MLNVPSCGQQRFGLKLETLCGSRIYYCSWLLNLVTYFKVELGGLFMFSNQVVSVFLNSSC